MKIIGVGRMEELIITEKRNKSKDKRKERKKHPYRKTYHKGNTPIQEEPDKTDEGKV